MRFQSWKNFGYGRGVAFAGKTALREMYGGGHFSTVASHCARWERFVSFAREMGISDAREINQKMLDAFLVNLKEQIAAGILAVSYAVNITSSVNMVLLALRGNQKLRLKPSLLGTIPTVRIRVPGFVNHDQFVAIIEALENAGHFAEATMIRLAKDFGFRFKEVGLHNLKKSVRSALRDGEIRVEKGTKGGQRRTVPITTGEQIATLSYSKQHQTGANFVLSAEPYAVFRRRVYRILRKFGICGDFSFRELRAAFACHEYRRITGHLAPVMGGAAPPYLDRAARLQIAEQLGHHRISITASYFGKLK